MYVDPKTHTTATLYGNDAAMQVQECGGAPSFAYPSGSVLALVTWAQREDPHWFGGRIPNTPLTAEFVQISSGGNAHVYRLFEGRTLVERHPDAVDASQRTNFILNLKLAYLP